MTSVQTKLDRAFAPLAAAIEAEPVEQKIRAARKAGSFAPATSRHDLEIAAALGVISKGEAQVVVGELGVGVVGFCPGDCEALALEGRL